MGETTCTFLIWRFKNKYRPSEEPKASPSGLWWVVITAVLYKPSLIFSASEATVLTRMSGAKIQPRAEPCKRATPTFGTLHVSSRHGPNRL